MTRVPPFIAVCCAIALCFCPALRAEEGIVEKARALAAPYVDSGRAVGLSIGLLKGDQRVTFHLGKVRANDDAAAPDDATLYEIGSVTKTFTALLLADEVARGKLKLDTSVAQLLPKDHKLPAGKDRAITLSDLATHTSGLVRMPDNFTPKDPLDPYVDYSLGQFDAFLGRTKLASQPGRTYAYSNAGSALLGRALTLHAKQDYDALLAKRIFKPLKMTDSATKLSESQRKRFATPHDVDCQPVKPWNLNHFDPAGGIRSNVNDMLHYVEAQLGKRKSDLDKAIELSHQRVHDIPIGGIALGWHISADKQTRWHNGQTGGFHTFVGFNKQYDIGVVVLCNSGLYDIDRLGDQLIRMLAGHDEKPVVFPKVVQVDVEALDRYVGVYTIVPTIQLTVTRQGGKLRVQATGQDAYTVYPESETKFKYRVVEAAITFEVEKDGSVSALTLHQNGLNMRGVRVKPAGDESK